VGENIRGKLKHEGENVLDVQRKAEQPKNIKCVVDEEELISLRYNDKKDFIMLFME
jgi:hypothetical protein